MKVFCPWTVTVITVKDHIYRSIYSLSGSVYWSRTTWKWEMFDQSCYFQLRFILERITNGMTNLSWKENLIWIKPFVQSDPDIRVKISKPSCCFHLDNIFWTSCNHLSFQSVVLKLLYTGATMRHSYIFLEKRQKKLYAKETQTFSIPQVLLLVIS